MEENSSSRMRSLAAMLPLLALGDFGLGRFRRRLSKEECAECGKKIPPGRAGRKCEECRKSD